MHTHKCKDTEYGAYAEIRTKAADGNRTHNFALAKLSFAVKLRPQFADVSKWLLLNFVFSSPKIEATNCLQIESAAYDTLTNLQVDSET